MSNIYLAYIIPKSYSGQSAATELIIKGLSPKGYIFKILPLYAIERAGQNKIYESLRLLIKSLKIVPVLFELLKDRRPSLYINLGQGYASFARVLWWYLPIKFLKRHLASVISLHGSSFMSYDIKAKRTKLFVFILNTSEFITVLSHSQKLKLESFGISENKILVIPNACELEAMPLDTKMAKQKISSDQPINLLYLSLLVESKGFIEYLEAIELLALSELPKRIKAVICGPIVRTTFCSRFNSKQEMKIWIENKIEKINAISSGKIEINWINGARGIEKLKLFKAAHIFIFPSYYPNEAQPLVLLEALSSGCAIVTSKVGEISSTLNDQVAILLDDVSTYTVSESIKKYIINDLYRINSVINGHKLFSKSLSMDIYINNWVMIFERLSATKKCK